MDYDPFSSHFGMRCEPSLISFTVLWENGVLFFYLPLERDANLYSFNFPGLKLNPIFVLFLLILVVHVIPHFVLSFVENWRIENKADIFIHPIQAHIHLGLRRNEDQKM